MKNPDEKDLKLIDIQNRLADSFAGDDPKAVAQTQIELMTHLSESMLAEAKKYSEINYNNVTDEKVLSARGFRILTSEEKEYYNAVVLAGSMDGVDKLMPMTIFDRVFEDLKLSRPLLSKINFVNTTGLIRWVMRNGDAESAWWGELCDSIAKQLKSAFEVIETGLFKLSAYYPVCKAMLDLGPQWIDRFVREMLAESIAIALEIAIVRGTGNKQPIGMIKNLNGAVVAGEYPDKTKTALTDLTPETLGAKIMGPLTKNGTRAIEPESVIIVVNPLDYWEKIFAQTTMLTADKQYVHGVLPIPATFIQSSAMPKGTMASGRAEDYFMGLGSSNKVEFSDQYQFLEDYRVYLTKIYGNGRPKDVDSFMVFDISAMTAPTV